MNSDVNLIKGEPEGPVRSQDRWYVKALKWFCQEGYSWMNVGPWTSQINSFDFSEITSQSGFLLLIMSP